MNLRGRTFILTGASRGIGRQLANDLAKEGASLVLSARTEVLLKQVEQEVRARGVQAVGVVGNAAEDETVQKLVKAAKVIGNFVGFIHNAGVLNPGPLVYEIGEGEFREVLEANLLAGYQLARYAYPDLKRQGEAVAVFIGSGLAERNQTGVGAYCVAKAAEEMLARQLAAETPEITCVIYRPGAVETRMQEQAREAQGGGSKELRKVFRGMREQGEVVPAEQASRALVKLLKGDTRKFHGKTIHRRDLEA